MKFKKGDLVAEYLGENIYLIKLTYIRGNRGQGYVIDKIYLYTGIGKDHDSKRTYYTSEGDYAPVDLEECVLIEPA